MSMVRSLSTYARFATAAGVENPPNLTEAVSQMATPTIAQNWNPWPGRCQMISYGTPPSWEQWEKLPLAW